MYKVLIADDEPLAHQLINKYFEQYNNYQVVGNVYSGKEAKQFLSKKRVDLLLLDISMPEMTGVELLKSLTITPSTIITSAYQEYALDGFELGVIDYLLKPFEFERFARAIDKFEHNLVRSFKEPSVHKDSELYIKVDRKFVRVDINDILYFEAYGNYVKVWLDDKCYLTPKTLSSFDASLNGRQFVRVHKSFIVNRLQIDYLENELITLKSGGSVPIGRQFKMGLQDILEFK